jgi:hypothetical protein
MPIHAIYTKDGTIFHARRCADTDDPSFWLAAEDGHRFGTIRFVDDNRRTECHFDLLVLPRYVEEIVQYLLDRAF